MTRFARFALLCLASVAALAASGCGNKEEFVTIGHTEGIPDAVVLSLAEIPATVASIA